MKKFINVYESGVKRISVNSDEYCKKRNRQTTLQSSHFPVYLSYGF